MEQPSKCERDKVQRERIAAACLLMGKSIRQTKREARVCTKTVKRVQGEMIANPVGDLAQTAEQLKEVYERELLTSTAGALQAVTAGINDKTLHNAPMVQRATVYGILADKYHRASTEGGQALQVNIVLDRLIAGQVDINEVDG